MKYTIELITAFGYLSLPEAKLLHKIASNLSSMSKIVNIGAGAGTSSLALLEDRPDLIPNAWTVDINQNGWQGSLDGETNAFHKAGLIPPNQILASSDIAAKEWRYGKVDFVFVDDGHLEDEIARDIDSWLPLIKSGGMIAFHDYGSKNWEAVKRIVDQKLKGYKRIHLVDTIAVYTVE